MYDYNNKSNEKQRLKSKKQMQHGVKIGSSLLHSELSLNRFRLKFYGLAGQKSMET